MADKQVFKARLLRQSVRASKQAMAFSAADNYGVGIRAAIYLQWYGIILTSIAKRPGKLDALWEMGWVFRLLNAATASSLALAAVIQGANATAGFTAVDAYLLLFLASGALLFLVPVYAWRVVTGCSVRWDPALLLDCPEGWALMDLGTTLFHVLVVVCQIWFWLAGVHGLPLGYQGQAFLFGNLSLDNAGVIGSNAALYIVLLTACVASFLYRTFGSDRTKRKRHRWQRRRQRYATHHAKH
jgi:hypothetical protein